MAVCTWRVPTFLIIIRDKPLMEELTNNRHQLGSRYAHENEAIIDSILNTPRKYYKEALTICFWEMLKDIPFLLPFLFCLVISPYRFVTIIAKDVISINKLIIFIRCLSIKRGKWVRKMVNGFIRISGKNDGMYVEHLAWHCLIGFASSR